MVTEKTYDQLEQQFRWRPTKVIPTEVLCFDDEKMIQDAESKEPADLHTYFCRSSKISK